MSDSGFRVFNFRVPKTDSNFVVLPHFFSVNTSFSTISVGFRCQPIRPSSPAWRQVQCDLVLRSSTLASAQRAQQWQQCAQVIQQFAEETLKNGGRKGISWGWIHQVSILKDHIFRNIFLGTPQFLSVGVRSDMFWPLSTAESDG